MQTLACSVIFSLLSFLHRGPRYREGSLCYSGGSNLRLIFSGSQGQEAETSFQRSANVLRGEETWCMPEISVTVTSLLCSVESPTSFFLLVIQYLFFRNSRQHTQGNLRLNIAITKYMSNMSVWKKETKLSKQHISPYIQLLEYVDGKFSI